MVTNTGTSDGLRPLRFLNLPQPIQVESSLQGQPRRVTLRGRLHPVEAVRDIWRIDDEWWREPPIHRVYYEIILNERAVTIVFQDLTDGEWYEQRGCEQPYE